MATNTSRATLKHKSKTHQRKTKGTRGSTDRNTKTQQRRSAGQQRQRQGKQAQTKTKKHKKPVALESANGSLVCFRTNEDGRCDVPVDLGAVAAVATGFYHTCAVQADGSLRHVLRPGVFVFLSELRLPRQSPSQLRLPRQSLSQLRG